MRKNDKKIKREQSSGAPAEKSAAPPVLFAGIAAFSRSVIRELFHSPVPDQLRVELADRLAGIYIQVDVVSALRGALAGDLTLVGRGSGKHLFQQLNGPLQRQQPIVKQKVEAGLAAHGTKVEGTASLSSE